jgi:hypothetical protein
MLAVLTQMLLTQQVMEATVEAVQQAGQLKQELQTLLLK